MNSAVNHPSHYQASPPEVCHILMSLGVPVNMLEGECILAIEAMNAGFHEGNAIKYLWRYNSKGNARENLEKALWYLERLHSLKDSGQFFYPTEILEGVADSIGWVKELLERT